MHDNWAKFVRSQLHKGGGKLFAFVAKWDKDFLNVDWARSGSLEDGSHFLMTRVETLSQFWAPPCGNFENTRAVLELSTFRKYALEAANAIAITGPQLKTSAQKYTKDTLGSDNWSPKEIAQLPDFMCNMLADSIQFARRSIAVPHQSLLCLHSCLGKPGGDCRTICKSPVT